MKKEYADRLEEVRKKKQKGLGTVRQVLEIPQIAELIETQEQQAKKLNKNFDTIYNKLYELESKEVDLTPVVEETKNMAMRIVEAIEAQEIDNEGVIKAIKGLDLVVNVPEQKVKESPNPYDTYRPADTQEGKGNRYYGYLHPTGKWFIVRLGGKENKQYRYAKGNKNYAENWRRRTSHSYKRYNEVKFND